MDRATATAMGRYATELERLGRWRWMGWAAATPVCWLVVVEKPKNGFGGPVELIITKIFLPIITRRKSSEKEHPRRHEMTLHAIQP